MITVISCNIRSEWDNLVLTRGGHPLQLWGWGEVKAAHNWHVDRVQIVENDQLIGVAQLLVRSLPWPFQSLVYIPRGPLVEEESRAKVLDALAEYGKRNYRAVTITVEPDWNDMPDTARWHRTDNTILIPRTLVLDLTLSEDELLTAMTKKTRQYIRKSQKENITIRQIESREELTLCLELYKQTANRAQFSLHSDQYYYDIYDNLGEHSPVIAAFLDNRPVAFLWLAISRSTAFELYGGMNDDGQRLRVNYALKWQTIQLMKKWGIDRYDMNGLLNDGVSTFKQGFASHETELVGTFDKPLSRLYVVWAKGLPFAKKIIRTIKRR